MVYVDNLINFFEKTFSNINSQASWDFSGRQIYLGNNKVAKVCFALDASSFVINQAIDGGCEVLITHHPLFFSPMKGVDIRNDLGSRAILAIKNDLTILSYHTNLDMAEDGINAYLLRLIGAKSAGILGVDTAIPYVKLSVFAPKTHYKKVFNALADAGAGKIGGYERCAFISSGTGTFLPMDGATPYIGAVGSVEEVDEAKIEMILPRQLLSKALAEMKRAHPYEVPAYDVYDVDSPEVYGAGRVGELDREYSLAEFIEKLKSVFKIKNIRTNMGDVKDFSKVAVCSGSGVSLWKECAKSGISVLITGDMKHHDALDAAAAGVCVIDVGHYHSERIYMEYLAEHVKRTFDIETMVAIEHGSIYEW